MIYEITIFKYIYICIYTVYTIYDILYNDMSHLETLLTMALLLALLFPLSAQSSPKRVTFVSIPAIGHVNPTLALAEEMAHRGWQPSIMTFDVLEAHVKRAQLPANVSFVPLPCGHYWNKVRDEQAAFLLQSPDFMDTVLFGLRQVVNDPSFDCFYEHGFKMLEAHKPDLMVIDSSTFVGLDIADKLKIPYVINNPALLNIHDVPYCMPQASYLPNALSGKSIHDLPETGASALLRRAGRPFLWLAEKIFLYFAVHRPINAKRIRHGFAPQSFSMCPGDRLILVEQVFGVEYARPVHPLMHLVGYLERKGESELRLESQEAEWLSEVPVVYVSFGTVFNLTPDQAKVLLTGLNSTRFRALWSLKSGRDSLESVPSNVQITHWVSSQLGVLAHPNAPRRTACSFDAMFASFIFFSCFHLDFLFGLLFAPFFVQLQILDPLAR